jgi:prepilin-type N-terminal cleavage/methylation domain-containing protein
MKCRKMKKLGLSSQARRAFRGRSRGFTLVEVLITVALIGAIAVAFFSFMSAAASTLIHADERTIAESLARSQLEYAKNQGYNSTLVNGQATYLKIPNIPVGYTIWSVNRDAAGHVVNGGASDPIIAIPWADNKTALTDTGLQMVALVIKHDDKVIYTFVNDNPNWADGVEMTLQGYVRQS